MKLSEKQNLIEFYISNKYLSDATKLFLINNLLTK